MPRNRTVAMASTEKGIHMPFTAANCTVMWWSLIQRGRLLHSRLHAGLSGALQLPPKLGFL
jgi:hypothetical protein